MNSYPYCACVAIDVIKSEHEKDKGMLYNKMNLFAEKLNYKYKDSLLVPFDIRKGDELIGVVDSFAKGYKVYRDIRILAWKYRLNLYFGMGLGKLETGKITNLDDINGSAVINAFRARDEYLKKDLSFYINKKDHVPFFSKGEAHLPTNIINVLIHNIYSSHTKKQKELIHIHEENPDLTYEELGKLLGYEENYKVNVAKLFKRANYKTYIDMQKELIEFLVKLQNLASKGNEKGD